MLCLSYVNTIMATNFQDVRVNATGLVSMGTGLDKLIFIPKLYESKTWVINYINMKWLMYSPIRATTSMGLAHVSSEL